MILHLTFLFFGSGLAQVYKKQKRCKKIISSCQQDPTQLENGGVKIVNGKGKEFAFSKSDIKLECGKGVAELCENLAHFNVEEIKDEKPTKTQSHCQLWTMPKGRKLKVNEPNIIIPYRFNKNLGSAESNNIKNAIDIVNSWAPHCIKFVEYATINEIKQNGFSNWVSITAGPHNNGCSSPVGMIGNGKQELIIGSNCVGMQRAIIHELLHTLGFGHEHQRNDRHNHLQFKKHNVQHGQLQNFKRVGKDHSCKWANLETAYDYGDSIMHYGSWTLANNGPVLLHKNGQTIKQSTRPSSLDEHKLCLLYDCGCHRTSQKCCENREAFLCERATIGTANLREVEFTWKERSDCNNKMDELVCGCSCSHFFIEGLDDGLIFNSQGKGHKWSAIDSDGITVEMDVQTGKSKNIFTVKKVMGRTKSQVLAWAESKNSKTICPENIDVWFITSRDGSFLPGRTMCINEFQL